MFHNLISFIVDIHTVRKNRNSQLQRMHTPGTCNTKFSKTIGRMKKKKCSRFPRIVFIRLFGTVFYVPPGTIGQSESEN